MAIADLDADGDRDLAVANSSGNYVAILRNCMTSGTPVCVGDGTGSACPCGNDSPPGAGTGCLSSLGLGAALRGSGPASLALDELALRGTQMPGDSAALYFQGTNAVNGGAGFVFGDGLRCAGGAVIRLGARLNSGGASQYPALGERRLSVQGFVHAPGERVYQVWYRNGARFCSVSTFNLTNGLRLLWGL